MLFFEDRTNNNTELLCPNIGLKVLIKHSHAAEVRKSLEGFYNKKKAENSKIGYTVITLENDHDIYFKSNPVEDFMSCIIRDVVWSEARQGYIIY